MKTTLIEAVETAMQAELNASEFYRNAAEKVKSSKGKDLLNQLADFEKNHYKKLNDLHKTLTTENRFISYDGTKFKPYQSEVSGDINDDKAEIAEILNLAIESETKAAQRYSELADSIEDNQGKEMFKKFAEEEIMHRRILSDEYYQFQIRDMDWFWGD